MRNKIALECIRLMRDYIIEEKISREEFQLRLWMLKNHQLEFDFVNLKKGESK